MQPSTAEKTVWCTEDKNTARPAKKRNTETWSSAGNASTTQGKCSFSIPSEKNARMRARLWGLYRGRVTRRYRRAHCCSDVASSAQVRLITRLENQSVLYQIADLGGLNVDGSRGGTAAVGGSGSEIGIDEPLLGMEVARICAIV